MIIGSPRWLALEVGHSKKRMSPETARWYVSFLLYGKVPVTLEFGFEHNCPKK